MASSFLARTSSAIISVAMSADEVGAEEFAVLGVEDELDEAFGFVGGDGAAAGHEGEAADADLVAGLTRGFFGQADAGDAGLGVGAAGDVGVVDRWGGRGRRVVSTQQMASWWATWASQGGPMMSPTA